MEKIKDTLLEARSALASLKFAPPELETLHFVRMCEYVPDVCAWNAEAGVALATLLVHRSREALEHWIERVEMEIA